MPWEREKPKHICLRGGKRELGGDVEVPGMGRQPEHSSEPQICPLCKMGLKMALSGCQEGGMRSAVGLFGKS